MTTTVLAYFPSPAQGVWYLGPVPIRAYALCIIAGIIAALVIGDRRWVARGGERGVIYDIALWAVPFGLIGGRLYHLMTDWRTYFGPGGAGIGAALRIWEGGLGIWGAVALGGVGAWIACRRRGIPLPAFGDAVAPGIVLAQAIGRLGNYFNQELYGRETTVPWGMEIFYRRDAAGMVDVHSLDGVSTGQVAAVVHPTFLYELLWNLAVFVLLIWADRRFRLGHGRLFALYVASYCVGRFWVELLRDDTATHIAGIRINVFTATFVFIGAVVYLLLAPKGREDPESLQGHQPETLAEEADEFAEELVAAAAGSGLIAAVTVAGDHDAEDAAAAADDAAAESDDFVTAVEAEEQATEEQLEHELTADGTASEPPAEAATDTGDDADAVVVYAAEAAEAETETVIVYESDVDSPDSSEASEVDEPAEVDEDAEPDEPAEVDEDEEGAAQDEDDEGSAPVEAEAAANEDAAVEDTGVQDDAEVEDDADAEVELEDDAEAADHAAAEDEPVEADAPEETGETATATDPDVQADQSAAQAEPETDAGPAEAQPDEPEAQPDEPAAQPDEPEAESDAQPDPTPAAQPEPVPAIAEEKAPKLGSSLRRLLWGARSGD